MTLKKTLLFFYDYFYPGYKAGGPIQSLTNLVIALEANYTISVITSAYDLHSTNAYPGITINSWNTISIPGSKNTINVFYADKSVGSVNFQQLFKEANPSVVYFNNIYSSLFFRIPLKALSGAHFNSKVVICPRGMLQKGALAVKPLKKKIYLTYLRYTGVLNNAVWHATNREEADDIKRYFPKNRGIVIASNIPKVPYARITVPDKKPGQLKLVYLSLIAEKKNLFLLLEVMQEAGEGISLDIYGPVTDEKYWQRCEALIKQMPGKVQYKGDVKPPEVQQLISQYHALILLTKGENFGHALYESLSVGRPVITSHFTPWNNLDQKKAGLNADITRTDNCLSAINKLTTLSQPEYNTWCHGAHQEAQLYYASLDTAIKYNQLFS